MQAVIGAVAFIVYSIALVSAGRAPEAVNSEMKAWAVAFVAVIVFGFCALHT